MNKRVLLVFVLVISVLAWVALQRSQERPNVLDKEAQPSVQSADKGKEAAQSNVAEVQPSARIPRIGFLYTDGTPADLNFEHFRQGLRELGYVEGKDILIEPKIIAPSSLVPGRLQELAEELVRLKVDIIVTPATDQTLAAQRATRTIPIVFGPTGDPVGAGLVASLAHPGGNITGVTTRATELGKKRLELLKEITPNTSPVGVLWDGWSTGNKRQMIEVENAARELSLQLQPVAVQEGPNDFEAAFSALKKGGARSLIALGSPFFVSHRAEIADLAAKYRLPAIYTNSDIADGGGLMSYGPNLKELWRRVARYVDQIVKGAKPADLPVEGPKQFEMVINLKAAKQIDLTIPESVQHRADRIIE